MNVFIIYRTRVDGDDDHNCFDNCKILSVAMNRRITEERIRELKAAANNLGLSITFSTMEVPYFNA